MKIKLTKEQIEEIKEELKKEMEEKKKEVKIRPSKDDFYFYFDHVADIGHDRFDCSLDERRWEIGSAFFTEAEAEAELEKRKATQRIKDYCKKKWGDWKPDWYDPGQEKQYVYYNHHEGVLKIGYDSYYCQNQSIYYKDAEQVIKDCESDLKIIFGIK